jgi:hypothetical protein
VFDHEYQQTGKIHSNQIGAKFEPQTYGIVAAISQTLLPGINLVLPKDGNRNEC